jgi:hypothetical protein
MDENDVGVTGLEVAYTLPLFASAQGLSTDELRAEYSRQVEWRLEKDAHDAAGVAYDVPEPAAAHGDNYFVDNFLSVGGTDRPPARDLRDHALDVLARIDSDVAIDQVRCRYGTRRITQIRNELIAGLLQSGYRCKSIADYLRVSDSTVSAIATRMRLLHLESWKAVR